MLPLIPGPTAYAANASDLFFSEYVEGSSNNKAVEIFNGTDHEIDLSNYTVELYSNGASTATNTFNFTAGTAIASGDVFVIVNSSSGAALKAKKNAESSVTNFNGDDTLLLKKNGVVIDTIGQLGFDPGTKWADSGVETVDKTLVRKSSVVTGDNQPEDSFNPSLEWVAFPIDTFSNLGTHTMDGFTAPAVAGVTANPAAGAGSGGHRGLTSDGNRWRQRLL
ncbi:hypothetical protein DVH26_17200 [Paenibacillus sp. H1-7]|nr:hypothetical protein DVH26_17200 [Paenibacillus sp. H1-7]